MCDPTLDRRALLRAGAGVVTAGAAVTFAPAAAGATRTRTFRGRFTGVGTPDFHYLPFRVPRGVRQIAVSYRYTPLETGLGFSANVIDIGLFDPDGFRGWSGGARDRFRVGVARATPGYLAGPIRPGRWRVALGPFVVVPPGVEWEVTVTLRFGRPARRFRAEPAPRAVRGTGPGWYRGDLHAHTVHSDGSWTQRRLGRAARRAGLDFLGSSEHNTSSATLTWGRHAPRDLLVLNGEEVTTRGGHWLAMGLPPGTWIDFRYRPADGRLSRFTDRVRALGGIAIAAHPWVPTPGSRWEYGADYADVDAVEIWNGPWTLDDQFGVEAWHAQLVAGSFVPVVGSSDTHGPGTVVGTPHTVVRARSLATAAVLRGIRRGHAWIAESAAVDLTLEASAGDRTATCGERLAAAATDLVTVRLGVRGAPGCVAQVLGPAAPVAGGLTDEGGRADLEVQVPAALVPFVRAEVRRLDGTPEVNPLAGVPALAMVAMTNPVFVGPA